jgi:hypothetical protein
MVVKMVVRPIAKLSENLLRAGLCWRGALESPETSGIPCFGNRFTPTG